MKPADIRMVWAERGLVHYLMQVQDNSPLNRNIAKVWWQGGSIHYSIKDNSYFSYEEIRSACHDQMDVMEKRIAQRITDRMNHNQLTGEKENA